MSDGCYRSDNEISEPPPVMEPAVMKAPTDIAQALQAEFSIVYRAGGNTVTDEHLARFIAAELTRGTIAIPGLPRTVWAYFNDGGKRLNFTFDKPNAENSADGFTWENPRVRAVGEVLPVKYNGTRRKRD